MAKFIVTEMGQAVNADLIERMVIRELPSGDNGESIFSVLAYMSSVNWPNCTLAKRVSKDDALIEMDRIVREVNG